MAASNSTTTTLILIAAAALSCEALDDEQAKDVEVADGRQAPNIFTNLVQQIQPCESFYAVDVWHYFVHKCLTVGFQRFYLMVAL